MTSTRSELSTRIRWVIVGLLATSITINLLDRQVLSVLASELIPRFGWTAAQYGYIASAFNFGMMFGQIPAGILLDRMGARRGLIAIFVGWSLVTAAHALAGPGTALDAIAGPIVSAIPGVPMLAAGLSGFFILRFVLGLTQCGNYTAGIKALAGLFPAATRSRAGGFFNAGAQFGSVIAPPIIVLLALHFGWRMAFVIPGLVGLLWLLPWLKIFPHERVVESVSSQMQVGQSASGPKVPLGRLIGNHKVLGLLLVRVFTGPITTFYWTWLPLYLRTSVANGGRGMTFLQIGIFASVPQIFGMTGNIVGGIITDRLVKMTGSVDLGRKLGFAGAFALGALSMAMPFVANDYLAIVLMGLALFGNQWVAATYIGAVGDIIPQRLAGRVNGVAGFGDNGSAAITTIIVGSIVAGYGWTPVFIGAGVFPILALLSVLLVMRRIEPATFKTA